jgi:hypothetical protein
MMNTFRTANPLNDGETEIRVTYESLGPDVDGEYELYVRKVVEVETGDDLTAELEESFPVIDACADNVDTLVRTGKVPA